MQQTSLVQQVADPPSIQDHNLTEIGRSAAMARPEHV